MFYVIHLYIGCLLLDGLFCCSKVNSLRSLLIPAINSIILAIVHINSKYLILNRLIMINIKYLYIIITFFN